MANVELMYATPTDDERDICMRCAERVEEVIEAHVGVALDDPNPMRDQYSPPYVTLVNGIEKEEGLFSTYIAFDGPPIQAVMDAVADASIAGFKRWWARAAKPGDVLIWRVRPSAQVWAVAGAEGDGVGRAAVRMRVAPESGVDG